MNFSDYADLDAVAVSTAIRRGEVSAQEVTEKAIEVAKRMNAELNALVITNYDNARTFAVGICTNILSSLPPYSNKRTEVSESSVRRFARTHPADPAPTMM